MMHDLCNTEFNIMRKKKAYTYPYDYLLPQLLSETFFEQLVPIMIR